MGLVLADW
ncbi:Protein of unknown function [Propionibacterium freudenreichii]|nr:Protein of unknown function [Propionibacterium freudenreichii]